MLRSQPGLFLEGVTPMPAPGFRLRPHGHVAVCQDIRLPGGRVANQMTYEPDPEQARLDDELLAALR